MLKNSRGSIALLIGLALAQLACDKKSPTEPSPPACTYTLSTSSLSVAAAGGPASVNVTTASTCAWSAASDRGWMTITSGSSGSGNGAVNVDLTPNPNETVRTGTLTIAGQAVAVSQEGVPGCSVSISPDRASFGKDSVHGSFAVGAPAHCQWSAISQAAWITVRSGSPGSGNGIVGFSIEENTESTPRTGTIAVGGRTYTVTQAGGTLPLCTYLLSTTSVAFASGGGSQSVTVGAPGQCSWEAESDAAWISITSAPAITGNGSATVTAAPNLSVSARTGTVTIAGQTVSVRQDGTGPPPPCTYTVSPVALVFGSGGGSDSVTVTTAASCSWTATDDRDWITIANGASGTGGGTVRVSVAPNTTDAAARTGTLTVAGQAISVRQDAQAPCTIDISPASASYDSSAATGSVAVTAPAQCQWSATSNAAWLTVTSGSAGAGSGTVAYSVAKNTEVSSRTGTMTVGSRTFTITQLGDTTSCDYSVSPVDFSACMSVPFNLTATITTQQGCTWTVSPDAPWITMTSAQSGSGSGVITFRLSDNFDLPRQSVVKVRWPTATAGQNLQVSQAGCRYAVSTTAISIAAAGGPGRFDVIQASDPITCGGPLQNGCPWTATSDVPWITITTTMPQVGDNPVSFTVAPNTSTSARTGRITVRDKVVMITQSGS